MAELVFTYELRGKAGPVGDDPSVLRAQASGPGPQKELISFESDVKLAGGTFQESGSIRYGNRGQVKFKTAGEGYIGPSPVEGLMAGAVIWTITEGDGEFKGAQGYITSNFSFNMQGEAVDNHYVRIFTQ